MLFKNNAEVLTSDGQEAGKIAQVVIDPRTKEVTHIVVRKGRLLNEDKVVPVDLIAEAKADRVTLQRDQIDSLPKFEEQQFITLDGEDIPDTYAPGHAPPLYWYPFGASPTYTSQHMTSSQAETDQTSPDQTLALKEGMRVISAGGEYVGDIEDVFVDPDTGRVMAFLVSKGVVLKEKMPVPAAWIARFDEQQVQLAVGTRLLNRQSQLLEAWRDLEELSEDLS